jgi:membrane protease YdiL (CAAX protease family)
LTAGIDPVAGIVSHSLILAALIVHSSVTNDQTQHRLFVALSLAPLTRILSLSMPLDALDLVYWYAIIGTPLFIAAAMIMNSLRLSRADVGLTVGNLPLQVLIGLGGFSLGVAEYLILEPEPLMGSFSAGEALVAGAILLIGTGLLEELIFRGVLQTVARESLGSLNLVYVSALFAVLHVGYQSAPDVIFVFAVGLLFALAVRYTGSIFGVTIGHGLTNITLFLIAPYVIGS